MKTDNKPSTITTVGWKKHIVRITDIIEENKPVICIGKYSFANAGGISTISGKPKCGKTFLVSAIISAFIKGDYLDFISKCTDNNERVLLCDTEQGKARTQKILNRIKTICNISDEDIDKKLTTISTRELSPTERLKALSNATGEIKPKLIIIDGIRDLLKDFNSIDESMELINNLMKLATKNDSAIIIVIHQNKADENLRGHLGSEICNKSETVVKLSIDKNKIITVTPLYCRDREFEEFAFNISNDGLPILCSLPPKEDKQEKQIRELKILFISFFANQLTINKKELVELIVKSSKCSPKTAERRIIEALNLGIIKDLGSKTYEIIN